MYSEEVTAVDATQSEAGMSSSFSALTIEYYTCLSRLERRNVVLEGVISSMTFPGRKWPQRWFILLWEASPSRLSFRRIFPRMKSKVAQTHCLHVHFYCPLCRIVMNSSVLLALLRCRFCFIQVVDLFIIPTVTVWS